MAATEASPGVAALNPVLTAPAAPNPAALDPTTLDAAALDAAASAPAPAPPATPPTGLTEAEAQRRQAAGAGRKAASGDRSYAQIIRENLFTFINITLIAVGIILIAMGQTKDAVLASGLVVLNGLIGVFQEVRAKRRLEQIALLNRAQATVVRDGQERALDPDGIVVGDLLVLHPGDQVFVDGRVVKAAGMQCDESLLTGESDPIPKEVGDRVFSGSFLVSGSGRYQAEKVGADSLAGTIAAGARTYKKAQTPLQEDVNQTIRLLLVVAGFFLVMILLGSFVHDYPFQDTVLAAAVVLGIVPSGLFLMIIVTYSMAQVRLANQDALIQQVNAVESLSNVDCFCMDKTGTLTANRIAMAKIAPIGLANDEARRLLGMVARSATGGTKTSEAIAAACAGSACPTIDEIPFSSARKWSAIAADTDDLRGVFALGAPEFLGPLVDGGADLQPPPGWTDRGLRVLLFAWRPHPEPLHDTAGEPNLPAGMQPAAWLGFADELRPNSTETLQSFKDAGITLKIISGDNPETVAALARQAGLPADAKLVSGVELAAMDDTAFAQAATEATVFGRVTPEQKERLVQALRDDGRYVAMTGDGVNDVLSLKRANLGIAMQSGSQATRNAADIVLLHDSFGALPKAFLEGQRVRRGLQDILALFLSRVFTVALVILATMMVEAGFPFSPGHLSLLTLLTVGIPTFGLALWTRPGLPPRHLGQELVRFVLPVAATLAVAAFAVYAGAYFLHDVDLPSLRAGVVGATELPAADRIARASMIHVLVFGGLFLVPFASPPTRWWAVVDEPTGDWRPTLLAAAMVPLYALILAVPALRGFFGLNLLPPLDYLVLSAVVVVWALALRWCWQTNVFGRFFGFAATESVPSASTQTVAPTAAP